MVAARDIVVCLTALLSVYFYWRSAEEDANPGTTVNSVYVMHAYVPIEMFAYGAAGIVAAQRSDTTRAGSCRVGVESHGVPHLDSLLPWHRAKASRPFGGSPAPCPPHPVLFLTAVVSGPCVESKGVRACSRPRPSWFAFLCVRACACAMACSCLQVVAETKPKGQAHPNSKP